MAYIFYSSDVILKSQSHYCIIQTKDKNMKKCYSKEFKETLITFYHSGQSVTQLSKEYDVAPATIYKWIDLYSKSNESSVSKADFLELKRQLAKVKEE